MPEAQVARQRWRLLCQVSRALDIPMALLGLLWAVFLVVDLVWGLSPALARAANVIWGLFVADFALRFVLAPRKLLFLRRNVLTLVSLALPALRFLRILRLFRVAQSLRLVRVLTSLNRGIKSARRASRDRGLGYVLAVTVLVILLGGAGMHAFERDGPTEGFRIYGDSLWWTAMLLTSIASEYWPRSPEGRVLALVLSVYGFALFGYFTAFLASAFIGKDRPRPAGRD